MITDINITSKKDKLLYTKMKIFHFKDKLDSLSREKPEILAPVHIRIKPTNLCNHNCSYCAYKAANLQLGEDMNIRDYIPEQKMMEIIDDLKEMRVKSVTFSGGGEPFCYPYLLAAVKKLAQSKIKFAALTNGARLNGELAEIFSQYGTWLRISLDGWDGPSYARYRGVSENEFAKVMKNMEEFKRLGGPCYLGVSLVIDQYNGQHTYELIQRVKAVGADSVKVSPCIVSNDACQNDKYHELVFKKVKGQVLKAIKDLADENFEIFDAYHKLAEEFNKKYTWCPYLQILPVIGADLNIYPCQDKAYNLKQGLVGTIKNVRFKDFWFSGKDKFFKINPSLDCRHRCVADAKNQLILDYLNADQEHLSFV